MSEPVYLGAHLRYPITVSRLILKPGDNLTKGATAMEYSFKWVKEVGDAILGEVWEEEQTTISSWTAPVEGKLKEWKIRVGDVITRDRACCVVEEACQHPVQISGLCAVCGKDVTEIDWSTERADTARAPINMTHDQTGLTVSRQQALKVELELQRRLLDQRKLSLVVDLDQTIIHACIDPTVGEWQRDPTNPNHNAVRDVQSFQLSDDGPRGAASGCSYYIKMRPGLRQFLEQVAQLFELHVYTMGTRAYAMNIAKIVDPDQKLFGNRVISRDENGNMTAKSLQRLFPVSTNMVVIIDDRADVWPNNRPNLIKVVPYDFFKGVGDINSSFLPKREDQLPADKPPANGTPPPAPATPAAATNGASDGPSKTSALEGLAGMSSGDDAALLLRQKEEQERELEKQLQDRPLLHMQEQLDKEDEDADGGGEENQPPAGGEETPPHHRHQVLSDQDLELKYLEEHLTTLHARYYEAYDARPREEEIPDVGEVLDDLKGEVLRGTNMVLSGLVPLGIDVYRSEIGMQVMSYGADLRTRIDPDVTHLVISSSRPRTQKVRQAAKVPSIKIVNQDWLQDSISQWEELDETPYLVDVHPADRNAPGHISIPGGPSLQTEAPNAKDGEVVEDEIDDSGDEQDDVRPEDLRSPIEEDLKGFDFEEVDQELAEFLADGSDDEEEDDEDGTKTPDGESDSESKKSARDEASSTSNHVNGLSPTSKRMRDDEDESDGDSEAPGGSALFKRLRVSRSRGGSHLRSAFAAEDKNPPAAVNGDGGGDDGDEEVVLLQSEEANDDADDDLGDDLEADLMAELDREQAEEAQAAEALADKG